MIVLASGSPRRHQLLKQVGITHVCDPPEIDERYEPAELPELHAARLARAKAQVVARRRPGQLVLAADTVVVLDDQVLGKPVSPADAERMLGKLANRNHRVVTAVALARDDEVWERCDITRVWVRPLSPELIAAYVATGEPLDKAGAYGVQGYGAVLVDRIEGDFFGVMGLPLRLVIELLAAAGESYRFTR
jgi:septum formation protein